MNSNAQLNENYKFRISNVINFFKDMVSASGEEEKELNIRIEKIRQEQDNAYMAKLEKEIEIYKVSKKRKSDRNSAKDTKINDSIKENANSRNNEVILEEKDR